MKYFVKNTAVMMEPVHNFMVMVTAHPYAIAQTHRTAYHEEQSVR